MEDIDHNKYVPQRSQIVFRHGYDPSALVIRLVATALFLGVVYITPANSPRELCDKQWIISFCIIMMIYITCLHAFAYFPLSLDQLPCLESSLNMRNSGDASSGQITQPSGSGKAYCTALLALLLVIWPLMTFCFLIKQGFDPYEDLTKKETSAAGGTFAVMLWSGRIACHFILTFLTIYLIALWVTIIVIRNIQKNGDKAWVGMRIRKMPFGAIFYQEGLYFDCSICLQGFWASEEVVGLTCDENHVYHPKCLKQYLMSTAGAKTDCIICHLRIEIAEPDDRELIDMGITDSDANLSLTAPPSDYNNNSLLGSVH